VGWERSQELGRQRREELEPGQLVPDRHGFGAQGVVLRRALDRGHCDPPPGQLLETPLCLTFAPLDRCKQLIQQLAVCSAQRGGP
jgi:hypothetical protein